MNEEAQLLKAVLDQTASLVWSTDAALRLSSVHGSALRVPGLDIREMVSRLTAAHAQALRGVTTDLDYETPDAVFDVHVRPLAGENGAVEGCIGVAHDITARRRAERALARAISHHPLTALPNRVQFHEVLSTRLLDARRNGRALWLLLVDVDSLHSINDAAGQRAGDAVLLEVAQRIVTASAGGVVAHLCGDEFAVLVDEPPLRVANAIAGAMARPFDVGSSEALVSVSIGIAEHPRHGESGDRLLRAASVAVRKARELGGKQHQFASVDLTLAAAERLGLESRLRRAIAHGELSLAYQPQVRLHDGSLLGVEALLRWQRDGELLTAASFIRAVEESPIIIEVGEWVVNEACRQMRSWTESGIAPARLALNVGARHFQHPGFVSTVRRAIERHGIDARSLELEITETTAMHNGEASAQLMDELRELGVEITIDDFGTGYSSLAYLKRFAITGVKIDQSFVQDLPSRSATAIVHAILATARALGLRVVAEGVEDVEQAGFLKAAGCDQAQGYWFARAMGAEAMLTYLKAAER